MDGLLNNTANLDEKTSQMKSVNLVLQFLFFELRYSNKVRKWFIRKLSLELDELLAKTTIGKFFSKLAVSLIILEKEILSMTFTFFVDKRTRFRQPVSRDKEFGAIKR